MDESITVACNSKQLAVSFSSQRLGFPGIDRNLLVISYRGG